jgi:hypothetical protein
MKAFRSARFECRAKLPMLMVAALNGAACRQRLQKSALQAMRHRRGSAMWDRDPYRDFLDDHTSKHHATGSALIVLFVVGFLLIMLG